MLERLIENLPKFEEQDDKFAECLKEIDSLLIVSSEQVEFTEPFSTASRGALIPIIKKYLLDVSPWSEQWMEMGIEVRFKSKEVPSKATISKPDGQRLGVVLVNPNFIVYEIPDYTCRTHPSNLVNRPMTSFREYQVYEHNPEPSDKDLATAARRWDDYAKKHNIHYVFVRGSAARLHECQVPVSDLQIGLFPDDNKKLSETYFKEEGLLEVTPTRRHVILSKNKSKNKSMGAAIVIYRTGEDGCCKDITSTTTTEVCCTLPFEHPGGCRDFPTLGIGQLEKLSRSLTRKCKKKSDHTTSLEIKREESRHRDLMKELSFFSP